MRSPISTNKKLDVVVCTCHPSYAGNVNRRIMVQDAQGINARHYPKITKTKRAGDMAEVVVEHLPNSAKA
jgi:hypothetical protein